MRMSVDATPPLSRIRVPRHRAYRIALTLSILLNVVLVAALYLYSSVESFMSMIGMAVGVFG